MKLSRLVPMLVLAVAGCAGTDGPSISGSFVVDAVPLPTIQRDIWEPAPAGCEGALHPDIEFGVADSAPELVVVMGAAGVVCVDTYSAVESELTIVDPDGIDGLWLGYLAALQEAEAFADDSYRDTQSGRDLHGYVDPASSEPQPQPSIVASPALDSIDDPVSAEPQPQPSDDPSTGSNGSASSSGDMDMGDETVSAPAGTDTDTPDGVPSRPDAV